MYVYIQIYQRIKWWGPTQKLSFQLNISSTSIFIIFLRNILLIFSGFLCRFKCNLFKIIDLTLHSTGPIYLNLFIIKRHDTAILFIMHNSRRTYKLAAHQGIQLRVCNAHMQMLNLYIGSSNSPVRLDFLKKIIRNQICFFIIRL